MSRRIHRWIGVALAIAALAIPIHAQNVLSVRVESLEDLIADIDTVAVALGEEEGTGENLLALAQGVLGLPGLDWVDRKSPLVLALPLEGLMLGDQGFVAALPVTDTAAAVEAIKASMDGVVVDEDGMVHIPLGVEGQEILLMPGNGYLVSGRNPSLVGGFDPAGLLKGASLPPGTIAAEFNVDALRAMIGMGLHGARQQVGQALANAAPDGSDAITNESANEIANVVVDWIETLVDNTRAVQLSLEVSGSHLMVHNHYLPVSGSGLQAFLGAQKGGMPGIARYVDGGDSGAVMVSNVNWTEQASATMKAFVDGYGNLLQSSMLQEINDNPVTEMIPAIMEQYSQMWDCLRGDMVQVVDFTDGIQFVHVSGVKNGEGCAAKDLLGSEALTSFSAESEGMFTVSPNAFSHNGVQVSSFAMDMGKVIETSMAHAQAEGEEVDPAKLDEAVAAVDSVMQGLFGEDGFEWHMAGVKDVWLGAGGSGSNASIKAMIDRVQSGKRGGGVDATAFAPFDVGAGVYGVLDLGKVIAGIAEIVPEDARGDFAEVQQVASALGAITGALELQSDALALKFAMPTAGLATIAEMVREETAKEQQGEHGHGEGEHGEGHERHGGHDVDEKHQDEAD